MTQYMLEHLDRYYTLEELSSQFDIPLSTMKKCFKAVYGVPVHTYVRNYRIQTAGDLLRRTDLSVAEIAEQIGYSNQSKFTAAFKQQLGCTPLAYSYIGKHLVGDGETMYYNSEAFSAAFECDVYRSNDEAGEFNYFFFRDDTMETTYHLELRYGTDLDSLSQYMMGKYAYWLAAGFDADADAETTENVIALFCGEK